MKLSLVIIKNPGKFQYVLVGESSIHEFFFRQKKKLTLASFINLGYYHFGTFSIKSLLNIDTLSLLLKIEISIKNIFFICYESLYGHTIKMPVTPVII